MKIKDLTNKIRDALYETSVYGFWYYFILGVLNSFFDPDEWTIRWLFLSVFWLFIFVKSKFSKIEKRRSK